MEVNKIPLFDTTFIIDLTNSDMGATQTARNLDNLSDIKAISVVTVHEYLRGIHYHWGKSKKLNDKMQKALADLAYFEQIPYSGEIARVGAKLDAGLYKSGNVIPFADTIIAATAIHYELPLVTRDGHFKKISNLTVIDY